MGQITVFLADWQMLFREHVHSTVFEEEGIQVIGEAISDEEVISFIEANPPDVVILDIDCEKPSGIEVTRHIKQNLPSVSVILVMDTEDEEKLFLAMKSGASGCITKGISPKELINLIRDVVQGGYPISDSLFRHGIAARVLDQFETFSLTCRHANNLLPQLNLREAQILRYIAEGGSKEQVAAAVGISELAVAHQLTAIRAKLVTSDRNCAVIEAMRSDLPSAVPASQTELHTVEKGMEVTQQALEKFALAIETYAQHLQSHTSVIRGMSEASQELKQGAVEQNRVLNRLIGLMERPLTKVEPVKPTPKEVIRAEQLTLELMKRVAEQGKALSRLLELTDQSTS
jgi:DNA-binding NarL/FixJ family response regulator